MNTESCKNIKNWRRRTYCGMVLGLDEGIGNIASKLEELGLMENTIIVFSSDNGGAGIVGGFNDPFRGGKIGGWEGSCRVPAFIRAPALLNGGGRVWDGMMHVVDFAPTVLSLVDGPGGTSHDILDTVEGHGRIDGKDLSSALRDGTPSPRTEALLADWTMTNRTSFITTLPNDQGGTTMWKLILGFAGEERVLSYSESRQMAPFDLLDTISATQRDLIHMALGIDWFFAEWMAEYVVRMIRGVDVPMWSSTYSARARMENADTVFPIEEVLPMPEYGTSRLRLFDIANDPYEQTDLSEGNQLVIDAIVARIHEVVKDAEDQKGALAYFAEGYIMTNLYFMIVLYSGFFACCGCCCCCGLPCRKLKAHLNPTGDKQETELGNQLVADNAPSSQ